MQCQNWFEPGQEMGEGEMTQLVPVRWLGLAGAGWCWLVLAGLCGYKLQTPGLELEMEMEMLHRCLGLGTGVILLVLWPPRDTSH